MRENPSTNEAIAKAGEPASLVNLLKAELTEAQDYALWSLSLSISPDNQNVVAVRERARAPSLGQSARRQLSS